MVASPRARRRVLGRLSVVLAAGLVLAVAPVPGVSFVPVAAAEPAPLRIDRAVSTATLEAQRAATGEPLAADRRSGTATGLEGFDTLGVSFDEPPSEPVLVRVQEPDGTWGEWNELEVELDMGPEPGSAESASAGPGVTTEPIWVDRAVGYEVSVGAGDAEEVDVVVVRQRTRRVLTESVPFAEAAVAAPFPINPRSSWSARPPSSTPSTATSTRLAVVHHTASSNDYTAAQVPGILRSIQAFHMDGNGWSDIAYNFLVDKFGTLWEGRAGGTANNVIGAHARGFNTGSVGVAILGDYVNTNSTAAAREAVSRIVGYRLHIHGVAPTSRVDVTSLGSTTIPAGRTVNLPAVIGHQDVGSTACPGSVQGTLGTIRTRALDWYRWMDGLTTPAGAITSVTVRGSDIEVNGWAWDPDVPDSPSRVHLVIPGRLQEALANGWRPDIGRSVPMVGDNRGFGAAFRGVEPGTHRLCVTVINQGAGHDKLLGCQDVVVK